VEYITKEHTYDLPPTLIWRHRKENLKKCSLRGLETRKDFLFFSYSAAQRSGLKTELEALSRRGCYILLALDAPALTSKDYRAGLFLLDATWRYAKEMEKDLPFFEKRSLPSELQTAYPREQSVFCPDPIRGLASVEALFAAYVILGKDTTGLLDHYYWKDRFLTKNAQSLQKWDALTHDK